MVLWRCGDQLAVRWAGDPRRPLPANLSGRSASLAAQVSPGLPHHRLAVQDRRGRGCVGVSVCL